MRNVLAGMGILLLVGITSAALIGVEGTDAQASLRDAEGQQQRQEFDIEGYFARMEDDVSVYDPASPWIYDKPQWRRRVQQMFDIRQFLDLNTFHRTETELDDMRVVTVYREIRRPEGSFTERLHGRITWVYLKRPDGAWWLWHDHTSEVPDDYDYRKRTAPQNDD